MSLNPTANSAAADGSTLERMINKDSKLTNTETVHSRLLETSTEYAGSLVGPTDPSVEEATLLRKLVDLTIAARRSRASQGHVQVCLSRVFKAGS